MSTTDPNRIIDGLHGTCAVAALCGVSKQAVSKWRRNGIPRSWMAYFRERNPELFAVSDSPPPDRLVEAA